jgi:hypothetical protein
VVGAAIPTWLIRAPSPPADRSEGPTDADPSLIVAAAALMIDPIATGDACGIDRSVVLDKAG